MTNINFFIKQLNVKNILYDIQEIIFLYQKNIISDIIKHFAEVNNHMLIRKNGEKNNFPNCCILFFIKSYYPICKTIKVSKYFISDICSLNQRIAIKRLEIDYNVKYYIPCHNCSKKILNGLHPTIIMKV